MSNHPIAHIEFSANDLQKAAQFYSDLFGWATEQLPVENYATWNAGPGVGGGFNPVSKANPAGTVLVYIASDDILKDLQKVEKLGGKVIVPRTELPNMGWIAVFQDPTGNRVGLFEKLPLQK